MFLSFFHSILLEILKAANCSWIAFYFLSLEILSLHGYFLRVLQWILSKADDLKSVDSSWDRSNTFKESFFSPRWLAISCFLLEDLQCNYVLKAKLQATQLSKKSLDHKTVYIFYWPSMFHYSFLIQSRIPYKVCPLPLLPVFAWF